MRIRISLFSVLPGVLLLLATSDVAAQQNGKGKGSREGNLTVGQLAPDFELKTVDTKKSVKLSSLKGKPAVLIFGSCT